MEVVNHSDSPTLARSRSAPAHLSNTPASGYEIASVRGVGDEADERQPLLVVPYARGLRGERLHLDHCDGNSLHFLKDTPMAHRPQTRSSRMDLEDCRRDIAAIEALIRAGHPDLRGLCLALSDWWVELRLIE